LQEKVAVDISVMVVSAKHLTEEKPKYLAETVGRALVKDGITGNHIPNQVGLVISKAC
jgi:hypothetical protein